MKTKRAEINDLPEIAVELSERDMRVVSGGLTSNLACYSALSVGTTKAGAALMDKTTYNTNGDWDTDW
jgi:hypothetical protein